MKVLMNGASNPAQAQDIFRRFKSLREPSSRLAHRPHMKNALDARFSYVGDEGLEPPTFPV